MPRWPPPIPASGIRCHPAKPDNALRRTPNGSPHDGQPPASGGKHPSAAALAYDSIRLGLGDLSAALGIEIASAMDEPKDGTQWN